MTKLPDATEKYAPGDMAILEAKIVDLKQGVALLQAQLVDHTKVSAAKHEAAMAKGARELKGAVIYRQGGKLYMMEEPNNETFRDVFDNF